MSPFMRLLLILLLLFSRAPFAAAQDSDAFKEALTLYRSEDFEKAAEAFKKIAADGKRISAALLHNIANCEYKRSEALDKPEDEAGRLALEGQASVWYRRALALDPSLAESHQNLRFLMARTSGHRFKTAGLARFAEYLPRRTWIAILQGGAWTAVLAIVWLVWAAPRPGRRWPLVTLLCLAAAVLITAACGLLGKASDKAPFTHRLVSLPGKDARARVAPAESAASVIDLPPGSELLPLREEGYWTYCEIPGGTDDAPLRGWVRTATTEKLWPWEPSLVQ
jgi:hypothetical protein